VGNGEKIRFWGDLWLGGNTLKDRAPRMYGNALDKSIMVSEARWWEDGIWV